LEIKKHKKVAILFGASGLVGGHCLEELLKHEAYRLILSLGRNRLPLQHPKLKQVIIDFEELEEYESFIKGNDVYLCLGTTRAKSGKEGFFKVDFEYAFTAAKIAALNEANQLLLVSSVGADKDSYFFYTKVKGVLEEAVCKLPFWSIHIFQPSFLIGERTEVRVGEQIGTTISNLFTKIVGSKALGKYAPVEAKSVAKAMVKAAQQINKGTHIYTATDIEELAKKLLLLE